MPFIRFVEANGMDCEIDAKAGRSLMQIAVKNGVDGILAECGGKCSCATCHCYIDEGFIDKVPVATEHEKATLEAVSDLRENSRLACQIKITDEMNGMEVHLPASQF